VHVVLGGLDLRRRDAQVLRQLLGAGWPAEQLRQLPRRVGVLPALRRTERLAQSLDRSSSSSAPEMRLAA
jgi:hypothetical protein